MRIVVIGALTLALLYYLTIYRWRNRAHNILMVTVILIALIPTSYMEYAWSTSEAEAGKVVTALSGREDGTLHCQRLTETLLDATQNIGHVSLAEPEKAVMKYRPCQELFSYMTSDKRNPTEEQREAVHVLTHESVHVSGDYSESSTECTAIQKDAAAVVLLGGTLEQGVELAETYYRQTYPNMPDGYRSPECFENGALDASPNDGSFFR